MFFKKKHIRCIKNIYKLINNITIKNLDII
jgi:hypothetical protein